ncbi:MAG: DUF444 family protein [Bacillota bacterium]
MRSCKLIKEDWSLYKKIFLDEKRHRERVIAALKKNLADIISHENLILDRDKKIFRIPVRTLQEFYFKYDYEQEKFFGQGCGSEQEGDILDQDVSCRRQFVQTAQGVGMSPGIDFNEMEICIEDLEKALLEDLRLPNFTEKEKSKTTFLSPDLSNIASNGSMSQVDKRRTLLESIKRVRLKGGLELDHILPEDLRYRVWNEKEEVVSSAVVLAMMDVSGSMGPFEKYIARSFFYWMLRLLRLNYSEVEIVFLAHHTMAKRVNEGDFFSKGESGGTRCSSVYQLALEIIDKEYNPSKYNVYAFHFSDGDNLPSDNTKCLELMAQLIAKCSLVGYGEIINPYFKNGVHLADVYAAAFKKKPGFCSIIIKDRSGIYAALKAFFRVRGGKYERA